MSTETPDVSSAREEAFRQGLHAAASMTAGWPFAISHRNELVAHLLALGYEDYLAVMSEAEAAGMDTGFSLTVQETP